MSEQIRPIHLHKDVHFELNFNDMQIIFRLWAKRCKISGIKMCFVKLYTTVYIRKGRIL